MAADAHSGVGTAARPVVARRGDPLRGSNAVTRLVQLMAGAEHGGAEAFFTRLAVALQRAGQEQRVAIRPYPARVAALKAAGIEPVAVPFRGGPFDFATRRGLHRLVHDYRPPVVLSWMNRATSLCPRGDFVHVARLGGYYDLKYYRRCDHLIANTRGIVAYLTAQGWSADRVHYLPNFPTVAASSVSPLAEKRPDAPLALVLGRLHRNKGFDVLLDALARSERVHLWLAGEGPERTALERQARTLGIERRVRFLGWRDDAPALLAACDFLVVPSRREPLGNTIVEAWAAERPVIATETAGPAELIVSGETGLLVPPEAPESLALALARFAEDHDLRRRLAVAGRARYLAEFSEDRVVAAYQALFAKVAA
ncbi:MAG: glycosyltransferase [Alphaproteobacteria bacterium]|nr:glycosyltransferase [Alphaproteobacteria bacterium]